MALIGSEIKPFEATAFKSGEFVDVSDADLKGKWSVVVFYPADFTFVCPTELGDLADLYPEFQKIGCEVYSVSTDTKFTHKAWHDASDTIKKIKYPMVGDPTGAITRNFDVMIEEAGLASAAPSS
jgi:alkyl hydroperoxide reductase subunit AhpC